MANTGYMINGHCAADAATAVYQFQSLFPVFPSTLKNGDLISLSTLPVINASTGVITYSTVGASGNSLATNIRAYASRCDPDFDPDPFVLETGMQIFAFFFGAVVFWYWFGSSIGAILDPIRKAARF